MAMLGHVSAEMSLRYGRLFDATVRADYERALTLAKSQLGPVLPQRTQLPITDISRRRSDWRDAPHHQVPAGRRVLPAHPGPRSLRLRQHLRALPELPHRRRPSCRSWPPNAPTPPTLAADADARGWDEEASPPPRLVDRLDLLMTRTADSHDPTTSPSASNRPAANSLTTGAHHLRGRRRPRRHRPRHPLPPPRTPRHRRRTPPTRPRRAHPHRPGQSRSTSSAPPWKPSPPRPAATKKNSANSTAHAEPARTDPDAPTPPRLSRDPD